MIAFGQPDPDDLWRFVLAALAVLLTLTLLFIVSARARAADAAGVLLWLNGHDKLTVHQAYEGGIFAVGATGSGKSSSMAHVMEAFMRRRAGMLVLTASSEDFAQVFKLAEQCGRAADVRRFCPGGQFRFDFLNYELTSSGGSVATACQLLQDMVDFSTRMQSQNAPDPFWPRATADQLTAGVTIVYHATGRCSVADLFALITSLPASLDEIRTPEFHASFCGQCLIAASATNHPDVGLAADYILKSWPKMGERTQGNIFANSSNFLSRLMQGTVRDLVSDCVTNLSPQDVLDQKIVVVDIPVNTYYGPGQCVQLAWKLAVQRASLRRSPSATDREIILWCDECQNHAVPLVDAMVGAVGRKHKLIQISITQNLPLLFAVLKNRDDALAWVANHQTKLIFANGDRETNEYFSALCGQSIQTLGTSSISNTPYDPVSDWLGMPQQGNYSFAQHFLPDVRPEAFSMLRKGAKDNNYIVDCYVFQAGRKFSNGKTWIKAAFKQKR